MWLKNWTKVPVYKIANLEVLEQVKTNEENTGIQQRTNKTS